MEFAQELGKGERAASCPKSLISSLCFIDTPAPSPLQAANFTQPLTSFSLSPYLTLAQGGQDETEGREHEPVTPQRHTAPVCGFPGHPGYPATATRCPKSPLSLLGLSVWASSLGPQLSSGSAGRRQRCLGRCWLKRVFGGCRCGGMRNPLEIRISA